MEEKYAVNICGREELLPIIAINDSVKIAFFNLHGNVGLTEFCAGKLAERLKDCPFDVILTAESKGLQLTHCLARNLGHDYYAVARKSKKLYMRDGIQSKAQSITTKEVQTMYLSAFDVALLKNKRVAIVDDVVSTGGSLSALENLVEQAGGEVALKATVLAEGEAARRGDIVFLAEIPLL